ncbi:MAG: helix-turn-helix transcriptional regulator [Lachnospiraceae bacterium]|nr:helix-turn-helix transcriptional regulator [Lachnospiraceae bacterium]
MIEFGEKLKQLREERGMTQQTLAEMLYVTRQAVSRWECGARYPDLLTTKKIATILGVTIDELVSGEKLKENIEKEPVLADKKENIIQVILYTCTAISYFIMLVTSIFAYFDTYVQYSVSGFTILGFSTDLERIITLGIGILGVILSAQNKLNAKLTGTIMSVPYICSFMNFFAFLIYFHGKSGELTKGSWLTGLILPLAFAVYIFLYFNQRERRLPCFLIYGICVHSIVIDIHFMVQQMLSIYRYSLGEPGYIFLAGIVGKLGEISMVALLGYQAYKWNQKRTIAIRYAKQGE